MRVKDIQRTSGRENRVNEERDYVCKMKIGELGSVTFKAK